MRLKLWKLVQTTFRTQLLFLAASSMSFMFTVGVHGDTNSNTSGSSRNPAKQVNWNSVPSSSGNTSSGNTSTISPVYPVSSEVDWTTDTAISSRRANSQSNSPHSQSRNAPSYRTRSSDAAASSIDPMDNMSSRLSNRGSRLEFGLTGSESLAARQVPPSNHVPWLNTEHSTDLPSIKNSSRVAWSTVSGLVNELPVETKNGTLADRNATFPETTSGLLAAETEFKTRSVPWETIESQQQTPPSETNVLPDNICNPLPKASEFALIEEPTLPVDAVRQSSSFAPTLVNELSAAEDYPKPNEQSVEQSVPALVEDIRTDYSSTMPEVAFSLSDESAPKIAAPSDVHSQSAHSLIEAVPTTPALLASHSGNQANTHPINLGQIATIHSQLTANEPIGVLPIARLTKSDTSRNLANTYSTEKYTGPMASAEELFYNLNGTSESPNIPGESLQAQRTSSNLESSNFHWMPGFYTWASPSFYHRPLYFEQPNLERYGMGPHRCMQPLYSGMHFFGSIALMPYKLMTQHPNERVYSLGNQRPGDPACYQRRTLLGQSQFGEACRYWDEHSGYQ